jgi:subfamily B ATP-binding cassette protein MsbA
VTRQAAASERAVARLLTSLLGGKRWALVSLVGLGVAASLAEGIGISLFIPLLSGSGAQGEDQQSSGWLDDRLTDLFGNLSSDDRLVVISGLIILAVTARALLQYANAAGLARLEATLGHELRNRVHRQLLDVHYGWLVRTDEGRLLNILANETWRVTNALGILVRMIVDVCTVVIYVALLLLLGWQRTLVVGGALLVISTLVRRLTRTVEQLSHDATKANADLGTRMLETTDGAKVIRAFGREDIEHTRFDDISWRVANLFKKVELRKALVTPIHEVLAAVVLVGILFISLKSDPGNIGSILVFVIVLYRLQPKVKEIDGNRLGLLAHAGGVSEVDAILRDDKPKVIDGTTDAGDLEPGFTVEHASFRYAPDDPLALTDITIDIPARRTTALVGSSGAGKSTLVDLLLRFHDPDEGRVTFGGVDLTDLQLASFRARTALVNQDVYLFNTTIRENIAVGNPDGDVERAADLAHATEFIERLPDGFDTMVGNDGIRLSGGQRQRLALARAIVRDPDVLLLDEATNALDSDSEHLVQEALDLLGTDRTVVVIAHRLSTIRRADHVVVLDRGRVVEQGSPAELIASDGMFARMWRLQHELSGSWT